MFRYDSKLMRFLGACTDYLLLNILYVIFSIPVFTAGAANTARYYTAMKAARGLDVYVWKDFTTAFFRNFKMATKVWLIVLFVDFVLIYNWFIIFANNEAVPNQLYIYALMAVCLLVILVQLVIFPFIARFEDTLFNTIKLSMGISFLNLFKLLIVVFIDVLPFLCSYKYIEWAYLIIPVGCSAALYLDSFFYANIFRKLEKQVNEHSVPTKFREEIIIDDDGNVVEPEKEDSKTHFGNVVKRSREVLGKDIDELMNQEEE